jgi:hypothetical protein
MRNAMHLPVVINLTCLTGAFQQPANSGTTIDERLVLDPDAGAVAVWSSSGYGVLYGHDSLERGFLSALYEADPGQASLGELTQAGYYELFTREPTCCQESLRTYLLLGDPLTKLRLEPGALSLNLPIVRR